jgi:hypothetical protein
MSQEQRNNTKGKGEASLMNPQKVSQTPVHQKGKRRPKTYKIHFGVII